MNKKWLPFELSDSRYFTLTSSTCSIDATNIKNLGEQIYPYITRTEKNNGIAKFISQQKYPINKGNVITIGLDTQTVFYQENDFYTGQNIQVLSVKNLNRHIGLFLIPLIKDSLKYLNWGGNGATLGRLKRKKIMLPVNANNEPDFDWMESFMKTKYNEAIKNTKMFQKNKVLPFKDTNWSTFTIDDIANIYSGKDWPKLKRVSGNVPFIGSSSLNNGVTDYVSPINNKYVANNAISINRNGSVGYSFYHPYNAYFSGDTRYIILKKKRENPYINIFITVAIQKQKDKYAFGYKLGTERIRNQNIMLPIKKDGSINYEYMENYMKQIQNNLIDKLTLIK
ncbi:restriction endonuclease subunit S [Macrococcoides caseolyticum]|uniref:restriction endonuclease subunit S n=1 Tax=Macrococcoides caseolyticum TaxID=69966 RepID=UPI0018E3AB48|nr:restriction endonuclease subunit S [Macrococcus caseolyticus]